MRHNPKLAAGCAVALLVCVFHLLTPASSGNPTRRAPETTAHGTLFGRGAPPGQSNVNGNKNNSRRREPGIFAVVVRLVLGQNASGKKMLRILNMGESPTPAATRGVRYDLAAKTLHDLGTPPGVRSILLRVQAREAFYLLDGRLFRSGLSDGMTFQEEPRKLDVEKRILLASLIGFVADAPDELLAISRDNALVRVSTKDGKVLTVESGLSAADVWEVSQQSVAHDGAVATIDPPQQGVWNLLIWPKGENSPGADMVDAAGVKLDPRWSDDGSNLVFVQEQPAKGEPPRPR